MPAPASPILRAATAADLPAITALLAAEGLPTDDIAAAGVRLWLAEDAGAAGVLGCGGLEDHGEVALVRSLVTAPAARGTGLGARLLARLEAEAAAAGATAAWLLTTGDGAFFVRHGYRTAERAAAPAALRATRQFSSLCPASAHLYCKPLLS